MKLQDRDINIINYLEENKGATIEQVTRLYFKSYNAAAKRLKVLKDNEYIKAAIHPSIGKLVYYKKKIPSLHQLVLNDVVIALDPKNIFFFEREFKIGRYKVDGLFIMKNNKVIVVEVDIFNKTKEEKLKEVSKELMRTGAEIHFVIVSMTKRRKKIKIANCKEIGVQDVYKVLNNIIE